MRLPAKAPREKLATCEAIEVGATLTTLERKGHRVDARKVARHVAHRVKRFDVCIR
jgi:hypothetical protein